ncbi:glycerol-3-phosphate cytidylyltransferase [Rheinheimera sp. 1928-s]|uniref:glycerol-3-phosphate cytidylyltransferase n=1 Tax=Rheinheimera sp. 1928-s TaxID=3033803 RepID=UPI0026101820|nr:glycerol-3-phosphate cytidylyltransferase [Rheinheimera sp. 1928-s]MDF3125820.1 glycerol-3-phosphate cytidylyltransferase [Rheinheimera sp. 1928-s]
MKTVLTYGTFDLFHIGHLNLLKRARELGDKLIVAVSTDEFNATKGKTTLMPFEHRVELVRSVRFVDEVIAESNWEQKIGDVQKHKVDVFVMGSDWQGKFDFLKPYCEVVYLPRTDNVSSTDLKKAIQVFMQLKRDFLD